MAGGSGDPRGRKGSRDIPATLASRNCKEKPEREKNMRLWQGKFSKKEGRGRGGFFLQLSRAKHVKKKKRGSLRNAEYIHPRKD